MENYWVKFILIGLSVAATDVCWTYYFIKVDQRKSFLAGVFSAGIIALGAFSIMSFVEDPSFLIASIIGAFVGTYGTVEFEKYISKKKTPSDVNEELEEEQFVDNPLDNIKGDTISDMIEKHSIKDESKVKSKIDYIDTLIEEKGLLDRSNAKTFNKPDQINVDAKWGDWDKVTYSTYGTPITIHEYGIRGTLLVDTGEEELEQVKIIFKEAELFSIYDTVDIEGNINDDACIEYLRLKV